MSRIERGRQGERLAAEYLTRRGYRIVASNWRTRLGELDLIASRDGTIVFVEVRTRRSAALGTPAESVGPRKQRQLVTMAQQYLQQHAPSARARIDVVAVDLADPDKPAIEHIEGAVDGF